MTLRRTGESNGLVNLSTSGAMIAFNGDLAEGDAVTLQLLDHGLVTGQVRWAREGRVGINFSKPLEDLQDRD